MTQLQHDYQSSLKQFNDDMTEYKTKSNMDNLLYNDETYDDHYDYTINNIRVPFREKLNTLFNTTLFNDDMFFNEFGSECELTNDDFGTLTELVDIIGK